MPRRKRRSEEDLLHIGIAFILRREFPGLFWLHCPNGGKRSKREASKLKAMGVVPGTPDLLFWWGVPQHFSGSVLLNAGAIELKSATGRLSPEQKAWRDRFQAIGGKWALARSYQEVKDTLLLWGVQ